MQTLILVHKMSCPIANLKKVKRSPLPGNRSVPFRQSTPRDPLLTESPLPTRQPIQSEHMDSATRRVIVDGIRRGEGRGGVSDRDLLGSMATRLAQVERELLTSKREIVEKDQYIRMLENRVASLEQLAMSSDDSHQQQLERRCLALQTQVEEMEGFLNDYGMVWVGQESMPTEEDPIISGQSQVWSPGESVAKETVVNFDLIVKHVKELNSLCDETHIKSTPQGATIQPLDPVPLILFKNGLVLFQGPFRPYSDPSTRQVIQDLTDGYFPSELQSRYPEGVPLQLTDHRDTVFRPREYSDIFPGCGITLGGNKGPSRLLGQGSISNPGEKEMTVLPGSKVNLETFLSRLPASVVRGGRVVDIRSGVAETLQGGGSQVQLVETPVLQELKSRLEVREEARPPTPSCTTTLRVRTESGDQTYVLKMKHSDTVGAVREHINRLRGDCSDYHLQSSFPSRTHSDPSQTLADCGLVPSANLFLVKHH